jgi:hypothetical protein
MIQRLPVNADIPRYVQNIPAGRTLTKCLPTQIIACGISQLSGEFPKRAAISVSERMNEVEARVEICDIARKFYGIHHPKAVGLNP